MTEAFLHYMFESRKLGQRFYTTEGDLLWVENFGHLNGNSGPDFLMATIKINETKWAGHIEFHINSSDWIKHGHQNDKAYNNVIAHFVWNHDREIMAGEYQLPVVELKGLIDEKQYKKYKKLIDANKRIPCEGSTVLSQKITDQMTVALSRRLQRKSNEVLSLLELHNGDQLKVLLHLITTSLGGKVNREGFTALSEKIERTILAKLDYQEFKIQALLHGLSGLLTQQKSSDPYIQSLQNEFDYQKKVFGLQPLPATIWKFSTFRPSAHPTHRIAQLAGLLSNTNFLTHLNEGAIENTHRFLEIEPDPFWNRHYHFGKTTKLKNTALTKTVKNHIIINAIVPFAVALGKLKDDGELYKKAVNLLKELKVEQNKIVQQWVKIGVLAKNAADSQALIELKNEYCDKKKCLSCAIGQEIMNK
ncbi:MAG: DUF2851 family protein [Crocinitomicaceae bacterium]